MELFFIDGWLCATLPFRCLYSSGVGPNGGHDGSCGERKLSPLRLARVSYFPCRINLPDPSPRRLILTSVSIPTISCIIHRTCPRRHQGSGLQDHRTCTHGP